MIVNRSLLYGVLLTTFSANIGFSQNLNDSSSTNRGRAEGPALKQKSDARAPAGFASVKAAAEANDPEAQLLLGSMYDNGQGAKLDYGEAFKWYLKAAEQGLAVAQHNVAVMYAAGQGVAKNEAEAVNWYRKAAEQRFARSQANLGWMYNSGRGVAKDRMEAYYNWWDSSRMGAFRGNLGLQYGVPNKAATNAARPVLARTVFAVLPDRLLYLTENGTCCDAEKFADLSGDTQKQFGYSAQRAEEYARKMQRPEPSQPPGPASLQLGVGTGFFVSEDGYLLTCYHLVENAKRIRIAGVAGSPSVVSWDAANDLVVLKASGSFVPLAVAESASLEVGDEVVTVGYPNVTDQGFSEKTTFGRINSKFGLRDSPTGMQMSAGVEAGNSGGALVNKRGNVVGIVGSRLADWKTLLEQGLIPQNVNYAIKSEYALKLLQTIPGLPEKLKSPSTTEERDLKDVGKAVRSATRMIVVEE